jgi:hypothetical protein
MQHDDMEKAKIAGVVALVGAAVGAGLALGVGLRLFSTLAMVGLGTGIALGVVAAQTKSGQGELPPPSTL